MLGTFNTNFDPPVAMPSKLLEKLGERSLSILSMDIFG